MSITTNHEIDLAPIPTPSEPQQRVRSAPASGESTRTRRLVSIDAYRGLVMVLMVSAGLEIPHVVRNFSQSPGLEHLHTPIWDRLAFHTDHVAWIGCVLWDLIQPSFMFLVGTAMVFSIASRRARGQSFGRMLLHAIVRSIVLVLLGVFLSSNWSHRTDWTFVNVLTQIGLGYTFLFLIAWLKPRWQLLASALVLLLYWSAFVVYPAPSSNMDSASLGLPANWHRLHGMAAHWEKNTNLAAHVDQWFLNLFPHEDGKPFVYNRGGYATLNFVPSLATMILGLLAGGLIRGGIASWRKALILLAAGIVGLGLGWALGWLGICPVVKRIWTPSWTIYSAGWCFVLLALFYVVIDIGRWKAWALPLIVVGMNSIAIYCMAQLLKPWVRDTLKRHFGQNVYQPLGRLIYALGEGRRHWDASMATRYGDAFVPMAEAGIFLLFCWIVCWWMYRKNLFVKI
jgi:predicted acyltransferase